jgi:hypothetical protein
MSKEKVTIPVFDEVLSEDNFGLIVCPECQGHETHHEKVEVFERYEDSEKGMHVVVTRECVTTDRKASEKDGNPSKRRSGIVIHMWCEGCHSRFSLNLAQHKGWSMLSVKNTGKKYSDDEIMKKDW